jgi:ABC-type microcin C transport system permease subunit YejE
VFTLWTIHSLISFFLASNLLSISQFNNTGLIIWNNIKEPSQIVSTVANNPIFSFHNLLGWDKKTANLLTFLIYGVTPTMVPAVFQRIVHG